MCMVWKFSKKHSSFSCSADVGLTERLASLNREPMAHCGCLYIFTYTATSLSADLSTVCTGRNNQLCSFKDNSFEAGNVFEFHH